jgi:hypothetical protein
MKNVPISFESKILQLKIEKILPSKVSPANIESTAKYKQIRSSIKAIGLIEPLIVIKAPSAKGTHLVLDGHIRLMALKELQVAIVPCLLSTDDESYTYNNRVNRLSSVQEHLMLRKAVDRGVSAERIADAFNVDVLYIEKKVKLLDGICPEAVRLLKDLVFNPSVATILKKLKPIRQVECIELMVASNNLTLAYAKALYAGTKREMLVGEKKPEKIAGFNAEQMVKMEKEMTSLHSQFRAVEESYGLDVLNLVVTRGYVVKLLANSAIHRYIHLHQPELLAELERIVEVTSLEH